MKKLISIILLSISLNANAESKKSDILGVWWGPEQKSKVEITERDGKFFGRVIALRPEAKDRKDVNNKDSSLRDQGLLGLEILKNFEFKDGLWKEGTIYDPENGKTYNCKIWQDDKDVLKIRGYIGISLFGRTAEFMRVHGDNPSKQQEGEPERAYFPNP